MSRKCPENCSCNRHEGNNRGRRERLPGGHVQPCGTPAAYRRHIFYREVPDQACMNAVAAERRVYRADVAARAAKIAGRPVTQREAARILRAARGQP